MNHKRWLALLGVAFLLLYPIGGAMADSGGPPGPNSPNSDSLPGASFTYQGQLQNGGGLVNNTCNFQFSLWDAAGSGSPPTGGTRLGGSQTVTGVAVLAGRFTVLLNPAGEFWASAFNGSARFLEIAVQCPPDGGYTTLAQALPGLYTQQNITSTNVIGGYSGNVISPNVYAAVIAGGGYLGNINKVTAILGTVSGGESNSAGSEATVSGGADNIASGNAATVAGGTDNRAAGPFSFAAGFSAHADHGGAFVWNCFECVATHSSANNQFVANALGGFWFGHGGSGGPGAAIDSSILISTSTGAYLTTAGMWNDKSDQNSKTNFAQVDGRQVLDTLMAMPVQTWNYKVEDASIRHMGPTAQDFYSAFKVGNDNTHLAALDTNGVALAAIQGLYSVVKDQNAQIDALQARVAALEHQSPALAPTASAAVASSQLPLNLGWLLFGALLLLNAGGLVGFFLARATRTRNTVGAP